MLSPIATGGEMLTWHDAALSLDAPSYSIALVEIDRQCLVSTLPVNAHAVTALATDDNANSAYTRIRVRRQWNT